MKFTHHTSLLNLPLVATFMLVAAVSVSAAEQESPETVSPDDEVVLKQSFEAGQSSEAEETADEKESSVLGKLEASKQRSDSQIQRATQWVDSFFGDQEYDAEVATTQFRIRPELFYRSEQGWKVKARVSFKFRLPNLGRNVSLVGGSNEADSEFDEAMDDDDRDPALGLQFFGKSYKNWNTSVSVGVKFNEFAGFAGPRFRYQTRWTDRTSFRFTQKILYQTNNEWQTRTRFDVNVLVSDRYFFRQMIDGRWRGEHAEEEGFRTRISSFLSRRLSNGAGLQGEVSTVFHTRPDTHVDEYSVALRYRKQTWRDWFYYEIVPQVSWEDEFDFKLNPGIRFRIEVFFGTEGSRPAWKREAEDTDDFRW